MRILLRKAAEEDLEESFAVARDGMVFVVTVDGDEVDGDV